LHVSLYGGTYTSSLKQNKQYKRRFHNSEEASEKLVFIERPSLKKKGTIMSTLFKTIIDGYSQIRTAAYPKKISIREMTLFECALAILFIVSFIVMIISSFTFQPLVILISYVSVLLVTIIATFYSNKRDRIRRNEIQQDYEAKIELIADLLSKYNLLTNSGIEWLIIQCGKSVKGNSLTKFSSWLKSFALTFVMPLFAFFAAVLIESADSNQLLNLFILAILVLCVFFLFGYFCFALRKPVFARYIDLEDDLQYIKAMSTSLKKDDFHSKSTKN